MPDTEELEERIRGLETAQATQAATQAGAESTQAAVQAGNMATTTAMQAGTWPDGGWEHCLGGGDLPRHRHHEAQLNTESSLLRVTAFDRWPVPRSGPTHRGMNSTSSARSTGRTAVAVMDHESDPGDEFHQEVGGRRPRSGRTPRAVGPGSIQPLWHQVHHDYPTGADVKVVRTRGTCTARLAITGRSSTCTSRPSGTCSDQILLHGDQGPRRTADVTTDVQSETATRNRHRPTAPHNQRIQQRRWAGWASSSRAPSTRRQLR